MVYLWYNKTENIMKTLTQSTEIKKETAKAILVSSIDLNTYAEVRHYNNIWLPKSKITIAHRQEFNTGQFCAEITLPVWLLDDKPFESTPKGDNSAWVQIFRDHSE